MELDKYLKVIEKFLKDYLDKTHLGCYVLGLSGGVDSSLCAALAKNAVGKDRLLCLMLPIESDPSDLRDAIELAKHLDLNYKVVDATETYQTYLKNLESSGITLNKDTKSNLKVRIRMSILYAYAQVNNGLVIGTDNKDERYTGYFTKYGDGACDVLPIVHLLKREVVLASKILGIPNFLAERVPSAGLYEGQTDEAQLGVSYDQLDDYLSGLPVDENIEKRILYLNRISEHKRSKIPCPKNFNRN